MKNNKRNNDSEWTTCPSCRTTYLWPMCELRTVLHVFGRNEWTRKAYSYMCRQNGVAGVLMMQMTCLFQFPIEIDWRQLMFVVPFSAMPFIAILDDAIHTYHTSSQMVSTSISYAKHLRLARFISHRPEPHTRTHVWCHFRWASSS